MLEHNAKPTNRTSENAPAMRQKNTTHTRGIDQQTLQKKTHILIAKDIDTPEMTYVTEYFGITKIHF